MFVSTDQLLIFGILILALVMFLWGRWRYDVVALITLLISVLSRVVPFEAAFSGFGHPAVVMIVAVFLMTKALSDSGSIDFIPRLLNRLHDSPVTQLVVLTSCVALCSAFMNNIGAMALFMPVALRLAAQSKQSPSMILMPMAFSSLLGGLMTLIGTPPNIVIANIRAEITGKPFAMFDFAYVGIGVAFVGIIFVGFFGRRFLPLRGKLQDESDIFFQIDDYIAEVLVVEGAPLIESTLKEFSAHMKEDISVVALQRHKRRILAPSPNEVLRAGDILLLECDPMALKKLLDTTYFELVSHKGMSAKDLRSDDVALIEAVVLPGSSLRRSSFGRIRLHNRFGINLLGVSRKGERKMRRLTNIRFESGDVLLLQGKREDLKEALSAVDCLPLAERDLEPIKGAPNLWPLIIFGTAILVTTTGVLPAPVAFLTAVVATLLVGSVNMRDAYSAVDWSIIILVGCLIPIGGALQETGATNLIARLILSNQQFSDIGILVLLMVVTMLISDLINNVATAVIMAPIGIEIAYNLGVSVDPFLMAVAIGSSCTFLTPIGHQSNTLVMGPGQYKFSDYWKLGLPLDVLIVLVSVPLILWAWPL